MKINRKFIEIPNKQARENKWQDIILLRRNILDMGVT